MTVRARLVGHTSGAAYRLTAQLGAILVLALIFGCTAVVVPPSGQRAPTRVFLLDHGWHASLVLPRGEDLVRYAYGDWDWYAHRRTGVGKAIQALFISSDAALGRRSLTGPATAEHLVGQLRVEVKRMYVIPVDPVRVRRLSDRLDAVFLRRPDEVVYNADFDLEFVPYPEPYDLGHNSNHVVAGWLRELGCSVEGPGTVGDWRVEGVEPIEVSFEP